MEGIKRRMERAAECFPKNERKMIRKKNRDCFFFFFASPGALNLPDNIAVCECVSVCLYIHTSIWYVCGNVYVCVGEPCLRCHQ